MRNILWVDVEATGLEPQHDALLEVGLRITNWEGVELDQITSLVWSMDWRACLMRNEQVFDMHEASGLVHDLEDLDRSPNKTTYGANVVAHTLCDWVRTRLGSNTHNIFPMAGNSVHYDRSFLVHQMPELANMWHYRNLDMSSIREACRIFNPPLFSKIPPHIKAHRPQADIDESIKLMNWLQDNFLYVGD